MKKKYVKRTFKKSYLRKRSRTMAVPRTTSYYPLLPPVFRVSIPFVQSFNYEIAAQAYGTFTIFPLTPFQIENFGPGSMEDLMRIYSTCHVKRASVSVTFCSREANGAESLNIVAAPISGTDSIRPINVDYFSALQSTPHAQQKFMSSAAGGHDVVTFYHMVNLSTPGFVAFDTASRSFYNAQGQFGTIGPLQQTIESSPGIQYAYTPTMALQCNFQVIRRIVFQMEFSIPHANKPAFARVVPPANDMHEEEFHVMEEKLPSRPSYPQSLNRSMTHQLSRNLKNLKI